VNSGGTTNGRGDRSGRVGVESDKEGVEREKEKVGIEIRGDRELDWLNFYRV